MKMQQLDDKKQLEEENVVLKVELEKHKEEFESKDENIYILRASIAKMVEVVEEMLTCRSPTKFYALFLKNKW